MVEEVGTEEVVASRNVVRSLVGFRLLSFCFS